MIGGEHLYIAQMGVTGAIKIGRSSDPEARLRNLQTGCPYEIRLILVVPNAGHREAKLHRYLRTYRTRAHEGEWFRESALGDLPLDIYNLIPEETIEMVNGEWWRQGAEAATRRF